MSGRREVGVELRPTSMYHPITQRKDAPVSSAIHPVGNPHHPASAAISNSDAPLSTSIIERCDTTLGSARNHRTLTLGRNVGPSGTGIGPMTAVAQPSTATLNI